MTAVHNTKKYKRSQLVTRLNFSRTRTSYNQVPGGMPSDVARCRRRRYFLPKAYHNTRRIALEIRKHLGLSFFISHLFCYLQAGYE